MSGGEAVALTAGTLFHRRYEVVRAMSSGGMGVVYEVIHVPTSRRRALKVMLPGLVHDAELRARFELEARVTADVESEHIVETFDAGVDDETGAPFLVMELLRGQDLRALLLERGRLPPREVVVLLQQASLALERTHAAGIIHRDLKPDNLFVARRDDGSPRLKILDFGIAKLVAQSAQSIKTTRSMGNPSYMAPEQIRGDGDIDPRADLYSLAHIAFALLVGQAYWDAEARGAGSVYPLLLKIAQGAKESATARALSLGVELPAAFDGWFARATALDPNDRSDDVRDLVVSLARALDVPVELAASPVPRISSPHHPAARASGATGLTAFLGPEARLVRSSPARRWLLVSFAGFVALGVVGVLRVRGDVAREERAAAPPPNRPTEPVPSAPSAAEPVPPPAPSWVSTASTPGSGSAAATSPSAPAVSRRPTVRPAQAASSSPSAHVTATLPPRDPSDMR